MLRNDHDCGKGAWCPEFGRAFAESEIPALHKRAVKTLAAMDVNPDTLRDIDDDDLLQIRDALRGIYARLAALE